MSEPSTNVSQRVRVALQRAMSRIKELETQANEPIAVVGMSCRFPGGPTLDAFWDTLVGRKDVIREVPSERLLGAWPDGVPRWAGLLADVETFDPGFFGISPREALSLDPQQRLLLEVAWEALEHSALIPADLRGTQTGVFVGLGGADYATRVQERPETDRDAYGTTGNMLSMAAGRISYVLGLQGPALTVDTACSSSLVAVHLACQSLRTGESTLAMAGGVNLLLSEKSTHALSFTNALSIDGRCKTFDASANGFVRGEGCGVVILKRLSSAERDGDTVWGVIRGSAVNQDGRSTGLTAPNGRAQAALLRDALARAGVQPHELSMLECHGTGTSLGDPIETEAIRSVFGVPRDDKSSLWLGAVKTNIGHLEWAAGIAGLIKILLAFRHRVIPANLHLRRLNPRIRVADTPLTPLSDAVKWTPVGGRRLAGVSAFGMSGTNAHIILEEPPTNTQPERQARVAFHSFPMLLSGRSETALADQAERLLQHLDTADLDTADLAFSLATTRTHFEHRACLLTKDLPAFIDDLRSRELAVTGTAKRAPVLALLFTGQGAQRPLMGKELYEAFPAFRESFTTTCELFDTLLDRPLRDLILSGEEAALLDQTAYTQPALFAVEVALFRLIESFGVKPSIVLGHSIGELAAAHIAGVFSLLDACKLVAARGRLMQALPDGGAMVSIQASEDEVRPLLEQHQGVDIAGLNGPLSTVISGDEQAVLALAAQFENQGRKTKRLTVSHAFHSHRMDAMLDEFSKVAAAVTYHRPQIPIVSNVSGKLAEPDELCSADYWVRHVRFAVRFLDGVRALETFGANVLLELGPHAVLAPMAAACLSDDAQKGTAILTSLRKDRPEPSTLAAALGALHCNGVDVDWPAFFAPNAPRRVELPTYAFQRQRFWVEATEQSAAPAVDSANEFWRAVDNDDIDGLVELLDSRQPQERGALGQILPSLSAWHRRHLQYTATASLRYAVRWDPLDKPRRPSSFGAWLVVMSSALADDELARAVLAVLEAAEVEVRVMLLDPGSTREQATQKIRSLGSEFTPDLVVSLLSLHDAPHSTSPLVSAGLALNLALAQALDELPSTTRLWMLTRSAVSTTDADLLENPLQAMTWGFGLSFSLEHSERWGGLLDLPTKCSPELLARLPATLVRDDFEDQLALRDAGLFVRRLVRASAPLADSARFRVRGTTLITGGTGSLGAHVARWLAREGVEQLVLTSRRGLEAPGARALQAELEALGPRVSIIACDVASRESVSELFTRLQDEGTKVAAIFHSAGVLDDGVISSMTPQRLAHVMGPKVSAALLLHEFSSALELDCFVLFSSIASTIGSTGQANYAAANAFLDALCRHRSSLGLPATSIAWGPWAEGGMATNDLVDERLRRQGFAPLPPEQAIAALATALAAGDVAVTIADVDWRTFTPSYAALRPRPLLDELDEVRATREQAAQGSQSSTSAGLIAELGSLPANARFKFVLDHVLGQVAAVLHIGDAADLEPDVGFAGLGLDSLMAVELRQRLQRATGLTLSPTLAFDLPSPRQLAEHVVTLLGPAVVANDEGDSTSENVDQINDSIMRTIVDWGSSHAQSSPVPQTSSGSAGVLRLIRDAIGSGAPSVAIALINALIDARRHEHTSFTDTVSPIQLSKAGLRTSGLTFYCIPSLACPSSPLQFARLAPLLSSTGTCWAMGNPGYGCREPLPGHPLTIAEYHTELVLKYIPKPFVLVGYSSGSWICADAARQLVARQHPPERLIFLDPGSPNTRGTDDAAPGELQLSFISRTIDAYLRGQTIFSEQELIYQITSMFSTFEAYRNTWTPPRIPHPTLFVHAEGGLPLGKKTIQHDPRELWGDLASQLTVTAIPHDHFDMIALNVASTAQAIADYIGSSDP